jgi:hypothetical protein
MNRARQSCYASLRQMQTHPTRVATQMTFSGSTQHVWSGLMFYEQIETRPPVYLRLLLPVPIETIGPKSAVGDEARCVYERGHLIKRITQIDPGRHYAFEVSEQALEGRGGMRLSGGEYTLRALGDDRTEVTLATHYVSPRRPRWFWRPIERMVCHAFHRHILRAMRRKLESPEGTVRHA